MGANMNRPLSRADPGLDRSSRNNGRVDVVTVVLVEDDRDLQVTTRLVLEREGFRVLVAGDGVEALEVLASSPVDVALIDVMLPRFDGISLTKRIREKSALPIVLLTSRGLPHDQIAGLEAGADDYVVKPFDGEVLAARLKAVLRRAGGELATVVQRNGLVIDLEGMTATLDGQPVPLSATEFRLLDALLTNVGRVLTREQLLDLVWGDSGWGDARVVDVNVQRLRAKIGADQIVTVRGAGYKMERL